MKTTLLSLFCLLLMGWGSMQTMFAQDVNKLEKSLSAISEDLNQKTKEYSWLLAEAYAEYCEANNKYISWNDFPYMQEIVEFERPASLEVYRLEHKIRKDELDKFLNSHKEYKDLKEKQSKAISTTEKDENASAFSAFFKKLREEENSYKELYYAERKAACKYRSEALRYIITRYKEKKEVIPTSYIKYTDLSFLLQKGSKLDVLKQELSTLEELQKDFVQRIAKAKYATPISE